MPRPPVLGLLAIVACLALPPRPVDAATIAVTTTVDELNTDGDCSLREAVRAANTNLAVDACAAGQNAQTDTITVPAGTYTLTVAGNDNDAAGGDLDLRDNARPPSPTTSSSAAPARRRRSSRHAPSSSNRRTARRGKGSSTACSTSSMPTSRSAASRSGTAAPFPSTATRIGLGICIQRFTASRSRAHAHRRRRDEERRRLRPGLRCGGRRHRELTTARSRSRG